MIDISVQNVHKYYGDKHILRGVSFTVQSGEHVGILGANGAGKTTLFRVLSGQEAPDHGPDPERPAHVALSGVGRAGLLSQIPNVPPGTAACDVLLAAFAELDAMQSEMDELAERMSGDPRALRRYGELQHQFELRDGFTRDVALARVCQGLNLPDDLLARPFDTLSGGEKTRINLGRLILENTSILLLDEPTNHLDMRSTEWLEDFLADYRGTVLCISHDRFFLDACVDRVIEIEGGEAVEYSGNYSFYVVEKEQRYQEQIDQYIKESRKINQLEATARRMHDYAGKSAKLHRRAFAIEKRAARMKTVDKPKKPQSMRVKFGETQFLADDVMRIREMSFAYPGGREIITDMNTAIRPGDRIALMGDNGAGKSTLLKLMTGELQPARGRILPGPSVKAACLPQVIEFSHPHRTLVDTLLYETGCSTQTARDRLGAFRFRGEDVYKTVADLSGGERSRLKLCILMREAINLLLLDEPTNHLDIASREWMEEAVEEYGQTLLFISHDRYFLSRFATRIWCLSGGEITDFAGGYEEYRSWLAAQPATAPVLKLTPKEGRRRAKPDNLQRQRDKERVKLERQLEALEKRQAELEGEMEAFVSDSVKLFELVEAIEDIKAQWAEVFRQWEPFNIE